MTRIRPIHIGSAMLALFVLFAGLMFWQISDLRGLRGHFRKQLLENSGFIPANQTEDLAINTRLFPWPDVAVTNLSGSIPALKLTVQNIDITSSLRFLPLLAGRIEFSNFTIRNGEIRSGGLKADQLENLHDVFMRSFSGVTLKNVVWHIDRAGKPPLLLEHLAAEIAAKTSSRLIMSGLFVTSGQNGSIALNLDYSHADASGVNLTLALADNKFEFDGNFSAGSSSASGIMSLRLNHPDAVFEYLPQQYRVSNEIKSIILHGQLDLQKDRASLENLSGSINGKSVDGTIAYQAEPRPLISATLAVEAIDLSSAWLTQFKRRLADQVKATAAGTYLTRIQSNIDLRASFGRFNFDGIKTDNVAFSFRTKPDMMEFSVDDAKLGNGAVRGQTTYTRQGNDINVSHQYLMDHIDLRELDPVLPDGISHPRGILTGTWSLSALLDQQNAPSQWSGDAQLNILTGSFNPADMAQLFHKPATGRAALLLNRRFALDELTSSLQLTNGTLNLKALTFTAPQCNGRATGTIQLTDGRIDLRGNCSDSAQSGAQNADSGGDRPGDFTIQGTWPKISIN